MYFLHVVTLKKPRNTYGFTRTKKATFSYMTLCVLWKCFNTPTKQLFSYQSENFVTPLTSFDFFQIWKMIKSTMHGISKRSQLSGNEKSIYLSSTGSTIRTFLNDVITYCETIRETERPRTSTVLSCFCFFNRKQ